MSRVLILAKYTGANISRARPHLYQTPRLLPPINPRRRHHHLISEATQISCPERKAFCLFFRESPCSPAAMAAAAAPMPLPAALAGWWEQVNGSPAWQDGIFWALAGLYGLIAASSFIQVARIQHRVPEYGWTTQKVFQFLNFVVNGARCSIFAFRRQVQQVNPQIFQHVILDLPGLAFFTTYAMLALFWAEISYQARGLDTDGLRSGFYTINGVIYAIQVLLWVLLWLNPNPSMLILSKLFIAGLSFSAALGFLLCGGKLFLMLKRFPIESKGRQQKLTEVGKVAAICSCCFLVRCVMMCFDAFDKEADLDVLYHPILNFFYYLLVEILPSALVLYILRRIPSKLRLSHYHPLSSG